MPLVKYYNFSDVFSLCTFNLCSVFISDSLTDRFILLFGTQLLLYAIEITHRLNNNIPYNTYMYEIPFVSLAIFTHLVAGLSE